MDGILYLKWQKVSNGFKIARIIKKRFDSDQAIKIESHKNFKKC